MYSNYVHDSRLKVFVFLFDRLLMFASSETNTLFLPVDLLNAAMTGNNIRSRSVLDKKNNFTEI
ncbi:hypothetical protein LX99_04493 [Mucilaginibacter oryzae]|uniref:Uncharacterized protein n=1 Tax=Mucilaginibacter oryzae TaxID=468058 RepID=A0A316H0H8_9SPHI|nr:hypothetical protein [Mucilaginibacter oryzae]PWK71469.1 hypothetical protein LX99_04493 [Mucilaginibacter oryzae]